MAKKAETAAGEAFGTPGVGLAPNISLSFPDVIDVRVSAV